MDFTDDTHTGKKPWIYWDLIPWDPVKDNIDRKVVFCDRIMMVMYRFGPRVQWPEEKHTAEQAGYIIKGEMVLSLPQESRQKLLGPGDGYLIGSNVPHAWKTLDETVVFIDVFSP